MAEEAVEEGGSSRLSEAAGCGVTNHD